MLHQRLVDHRTPLVVIGIVLSFGFAVIADYLAPWPYVMTPLYAMPPLIAVAALPPRKIVWLSLVMVLVNVASSLIQSTPTSIWLLYTFGLLVTNSATTLLAYSRQQLAREVVAAEDARDHLGLFVRMVAHELGAPLTIQLGYAQRLQRGDVKPGELREGLEAIERSAKRLSRLARDLSDAEEMSQGSFVISTQSVDLARLVQDAASTWDSVAAGRVEVSTPSEILGMWDADRLAQVVHNLVSNAVKYGGEGVVDVTAAATPAEARIAVTDQGPGIRPDEIPLLFQPFRRLPTSAIANGTGLGLYIARGIVEAHGGEIHVRSTPGAGSTFEIVLPRGR